ncbi:flagellar biosynthesis protein FlgA [Aidingimonas halophila]|uniref:Predicted homoserine dehydrogenase, contains C-terminal SAF domain n=1 Tax=Aidingimonas halophila TaxID=574349 RepID=A0A1H2RRJ3_9GAMM|nr:flagellar biosynthesis protein FlgA [Aidingimonas halophila]GHC18898.1 NAD-binding homoserine dehydrogenase [Aidingimonas halophila]SDW21404.1 Predicted homoserine dehydrogenase, contains C-terminal SAF domain [Aidingimonas halophila]
MNYLQHFDFSGIVEVCVVGVGDFGRGVLRQSGDMETLSARIAVDVSADVAYRALLHSGVSDSDIMVCRSWREAKYAWDSGYFIASGALDTVIGLPFHVLVESTGIPEVGAKHAYDAIMAGKHVGIATKETESVVGPYLTHLANSKGRIFTPLDGDQPSLLIGLVTWARTLGFEIVAAGKSSEYDFIWDEDTQHIECNEERYFLPAMKDLWSLPRGREVDMIAARSESLDAIPLISVPDLCEMTNVANATGLLPDRPEFHATVLRIPEVPTLLDTVDNGGVLGGHERLEVFNCLRKPDEVSFAGGVFVVVRCKDNEAWEMLHGKGHILSRSEQSAMIYLPRHLLGLEAPISLLDMVINGVTCGGGQNTRPRVDLVARATEALSAGHIFEMRGHHRNIAGLQPEVHASRALEPAGHAPFYMLPGARLTRDVEAHEIIPFAALEIEDSTLLQLRYEQDALFSRENM